MTLEAVCFVFLSLRDKSSLVCTSRGGRRKDVRESMRHLLTHSRRYLPEIPSQLLLLLRMPPNRSYNLAQRNTPNVTSQCDAYGCPGVSLTWCGVGAQHTLTSPGQAVGLMGQSTARVCRKHPARMGSVSRVAIGDGQRATHGAFAITAGPPRRTS